jgi:hypothetical protein
LATVLIYQVPGSRFQPGLSRRSTLLKRFIAVRISIYDEEYGRPTATPDSIRPKVNLDGSGFVLGLLKEGRSAYSECGTLRELINDANASVLNDSRKQGLPVA